MPNLQWLFRAFDHIFVKLIEQCLPLGKAVPSSCVDLFYGVFMSAVAIGIMQPTAPDTAGFVPPPSQRPTVAEAVERFAPEVRLHPEERYFPSSVEWYLGRTQMRLEVEGGGDVPTVAAGELSPTALPTVDTLGYRSKRERSKRYFLQIRNDDSEGTTRAGKLGTARTYVHVRPAANGARGYDIQYWFFYPYSGPMIGGPAGGAHEGDWEHITVRVDKKLRQIKKVFFAAHDAEGRWMRPAAVRFRQGTHPVVYVGRYSHASYARPGVQPRGMLPADHTADGGVVWQTWDNPKIVSNQVDPRDVKQPARRLPKVDWLRYAGRWGEVGAVFSGPRGPAFQHYWVADK